MELKIKEILFPEVIEFNFEELKAEVQERTAHYSTLVYTKEQIPAAKKDLATLRKLVKALNDAKIAEKKKCLKPYEDFESKIKQLMGIINEPIQMIDTQLKGYEEQRKQEKYTAIVAYFESCNPPDWLRFEKIFCEKWLNATEKAATIKQEITERLDGIERDLQTLSELPEYGFEAIEMYKDTLDINRAINAGKHLATMAKLAEHARQETKQETQVPASNEAPEIVDESSESEEYPREWISFKANLTQPDALALKAFFESRNIEYKPI